MHPCISKYQNIYKYKVYIIFTMENNNISKSIRIFLYEKNQKSISKSFREAYLLFWKQSFPRVSRTCVFVRNNYKTLCSFDVLRVYIEQHRIKSIWTWHPQMAHQKCQAVLHFQSYTHKIVILSILCNIY